MHNYGLSGGAATAYMPWYCGTFWNMAQVALGYQYLLILLEQKVILTELVMLWNSNIELYHAKPMYTLKYYVL